MNEMNKIMNNLYNDEVAADLEAIEEINSIETFDVDDCCKGTEFCCPVFVPNNFTKVSNTANFGYSDLNIEITENPESATCIINDCTVKIPQFNIKGCIKVHSSFVVQQEGKIENKITICCSQCVYINDCIICCEKPSNDNFTITLISIDKINRVVCNSAPYEIKGKISFACPDLA